jgi:predicted dehydrogenase/glycosyltransferase involved in cell wall biosynthesis
VAEAGLRILLATDSREPSGVGRHMLTLAAGLAVGHRPRLLFPAQDGGQRFVAQAEADGLDAVAVDIEDEKQLARAIGDWAPDVWHVHAGIGWEGQALCAAGRDAGVPVVRTEHLPWLITDPAQVEAYARAARDVDAFIAVSDAAGATWAPVLAPLGRRLAVIRNGIAPPAGASREAARARLGIPAPAPVLLCVARFTPQKDHPTLIAAFTALRRRHPQARLLLAGEGPERAACEARVALRQVEGVAFLGYRDDIGELLAAADLLVLPSRFEGLPLVVLEAMAVGLPVVATRIGGTLEALGDGHGYLCEAGDARDLARCLERALADAEAARACARQQRRRFDALFTAGRMADETARLYRSMLRTAAFRPRQGARMRKTRIGFVGAGGIAHRHFGVLERFEDVEIAGVADPDACRARAATERTGARAFPDHATMLAELDLDALFICVPPFAHGAPERAAIERGLPFLVEKPISLDEATALEIDEAVRRTGLVTAVGYHWRYLDTVDEARRLLAENPAHLMSGYWLDQTPPPAWWWRADRSGGQIVEQATHIIDLARFLAGDVVEVFGLATHRERPDFPGLDVATASTATLRFASGAICNLAATCLLRWGHRMGLHVYADALAIEITDHDLMVDVGRGRPTRGADGDPVWREDRAFIDAVRGGENRIRAPYAEALQTHLVALAVARSAQSGAPVRMEGLRADPQPMFRAAAAAVPRVA